MTSLAMWFWQDQTQTDAFMSRLIGPKLHLVQYYYKLEMMQNLEQLKLLKMQEACVCLKKQKGDCACDQWHFYQEAQSMLNLTTTHTLEKQQWEDGPSRNG